MEQAIVREIGKCHFGRRRRGFSSSDQPAFRASLEDGGDGGRGGAMVSRIRSQKPASLIRRGKLRARATCRGRRTATPKRAVSVRTGFRVLWVFAATPQRPGRSSCVSHPFPLLLEACSSVEELRCEGELVSPPAQRGRRSASTP